MKLHRPGRKLGILIVLAMYGSLTLATCVGRLNTAVVEGSKDFVFDLLNDVTTDIISSLVPDSETPEGM